MESTATQPAPDHETLSEEPTIEEERSPWEEFITAPRLTGDWGGARTTLEDHGVLFKIYYNTTYGINARGGADTTNAHRLSGTVDLFNVVDFQKMGLWENGQLLVQTKGRFSRNVNDKVGALADPYDDADGDKPIYIDQLWYQHQFLKGAWQVRLGYLDTNVIIDRNRYAAFEDKYFMNTYLDNNNVMVPPRIGLGAATWVQPTEWLEFVAAGMDAEGGLFRPGFDTAFHDTADFFGFFETHLKPKIPSPNGPLPGVYRFGLVYDPRTKREFPVPTSAAPVRMNRSDWGFYVSFEQQLYRESEADDQGLGGFFRFGWRQGKVNRLNRFYSGGFEYKGLFPGRDEDLLGLGYYTIRSSPRYRERVNDRFEGESAYELYYSFQVTPWMTFSPDIQYIIDPGGDREARNATVFGFRVRVTF